MLLTSTAAMNSASAAAPDFQSKHLAVSLSPLRPAFTWFALDSLAQGKVQQNPVLTSTGTTAMKGLKLTDRFTYTLNDLPAWRVKCSEKKLTLSSDFAGRCATAALGVQPRGEPPHFAQHLRISNTDPLAGCCHGPWLGLERYS